uniref:Clp protease N-terminal domain-containing protein n=1 Tax=Sporichthya sp. TaxID=65475 RepID=UPI0017E835BD
MFERFSDEARGVVARAQDEARALGHCWIGAEHLFLGVLDAPAGAGPGELEPLGLTATVWREAVLDVLGPRGRLGPTDTDAEALGTLGIDLHEIRRRAEERFGPGVLDVPPPGRAGRWRR